MKRENNTEFLVVITNVRNEVRVLVSSKRFGLRKKKEKSNLPKPIIMFNVLGREIMS